MTNHQMRLWAVLNVLGFAIMIAANGMANALPINGVTTGEVSDMYPNLFTPAGFTFAIWGLIYLWLFVFVVYQAVKGWSAADGTVRQVGPFFLVSSLANALWIFAWHHQLIWLSWILMLVLLGALIQLYRRLRSEPGTAVA